MLFSGNLEKFKFLRAKPLSKHTDKDASRGVDVKATHETIKYFSKKS